MSVFSIETSESYAWSRCHDEICENLINTEVITRLESAGVLCHMEIQKLKAQKTDCQQNRILVQLLAAKGPNELQLFISSLQETGHDALADKLTQAIKCATVRRQEDKKTRQNFCSFFCSCFCCMTIIVIIAFGSLVASVNGEYKSANQFNNNKQAKDPFCAWFGAGPFCDGECVWPFTQPSGQNSTQGCTTGQKVYCCKQYIGEGDNCKWVGDSPFCSGFCEPPFIHQYASKHGDGQSCWTGQKVLCCY